jgi:hypothetical protein
LSYNKEYEFLSSVINPVWTSEVWTETKNVTDDGGITFKMETDNLIFGAYFFLADTQVKHNMFRFNLLTFLSSLGGLMTSLMKGLGLMIAFYNGQS